MDYIFNIQGCLNKYKDCRTARKIFNEAQRHLTKEDFIELVYSIFKVSVLKSSEQLTDFTSEKYYWYKDGVLGLLKDVEPDRHMERYDEFERHLKLLKEKSEQEQRKKLKSEHELRVKKLKEKKCLIESRALKLEVAKKDAMKKRVVDKLEEEFKNNFLGVESFYNNHLSSFISLEDFEERKSLFVRSWIEQHMPKGTQLPDDEQIKAIASVNANIQVTARAGSGKTSTVVNRAIFLQKHCGVSPNEMLLLTFNKKAAQEVHKRILLGLDKRARAAIKKEIEIRKKSSSIKASDEIEINAVYTVAKSFNISIPHVMTFHSLAYSIVHPEEKILFDGPDETNQVLSKFVAEIRDDYLKVPKHKAEIRNLMLEHFRNDWDKVIKKGLDKSKEELLQYRRCLPRVALSGVPVKSYGEKIIADFLFEHNVSFIYEKNHNWNGVNYRPDFTIEDLDRSMTKIIIEYFGMEGDPDYDEMSENKREYWSKKQGSKLIEVCPSDISSRGVASFREWFKRILINCGIECSLLSEDAIWKKIKNQTRADYFSKAMNGFIGKCRKSNLSPDDLAKKINSHSSLNFVEDQFIKVGLTLYRAYLRKLDDEGKDDFDGLMCRASELIRNSQTSFRRRHGCGDLKKIRYVFIDEFQDFSELFMELISAIREQNSKVELFCVGDDWQAINGFAGSDLKFFGDFNHFIGQSKHLNISTNYRSFSSIVDVSNSLMKGLGEPAQPNKKELGSVLLCDLAKFSPSPVESDDYGGDIVTPLVLRLINQAIKQNHSVVILSRTNDIRTGYINYKSIDSNLSKGTDRYLKLIHSFLPKEHHSKVQVSTTHQYKGLEKQMVIIIDAIDRSYPLVHPDWAFTRVLGNSLKNLIGEERRLFYVALTRAEETLAIITDSANKSSFLERISELEIIEEIDWDKYQPLPSRKKRWIVKIGNQSGYSFKPTMDIKDKLKILGYQYNTEKKGQRYWYKFYTRKDDLSQLIESLKSEPWAIDADGLGIKIFDELNTLYNQYRINNGVWKQVPVGRKA